MPQRLILAMLIACLGCSPDDTLGTTTTVGPTTTVTGATTSTAASSAATTEILPTTTMLPATTTTAHRGNWANLPLVTTAFGALGWWDGSKWVVAEDEGALPVVGGEIYQVVAVGASGVTTGGPQVLTCDPLALLGVDLVDPELLGQWPGPYGVAVSAPWQITPHRFEAFADNGTYAGFARELLASRGLDVPNPRIKQLYRVDLEGDGVNEVLVVAEEISDGYIFPKVGDYSIAYLRKVVGSEVETAVLGASVVTSEDQLIEAFSIGGVGDLNGDGKMEIVISAAYYEGLGVAVWEYVDDDLGPTLQLSIGCGA